MSVSGAGLRWPLVCQALSPSSYTTSSGFPLKYGQADKGAAAAQYACCHNKEEAGTQFSAAKGAEHPTSLGFLGCDPQRSLDYNHLVAHPWSRPGHEDKEKRMTRIRYRSFCLYTMINSTCGPFLSLWQFLYTLICMLVLMLRTLSRYIVQVPPSWWDDLSVGSHIKYMNISVILYVIYV